MTPTPEGLTLPLRADEGNIYDATGRYIAECHDSGIAAYLVSCVNAGGAKCDEVAKPEAGPMRNTESPSGVQALGSSGSSLSLNAQQPSCAICGLPESSVIHAGRVDLYAHPHLFMILIDRLSQRQPAGTAWNVGISGLLSMHPYPETGKRSMGTTPSSGATATRCCAMP